MDYKLNFKQYGADLVSNAARWFDENYPGWHQKVDPSQLNMSSCTRCVLGQLFDLHQDYSWIRINAEIKDRMGSTITGYGIGLFAGYGDLWRHEIQLRRDADEAAKLPVKVAEEAGELTYA